MQLAPLEQPVPHSAGTRRPVRALPALACDAHMHIFDPRFAPSPHWPRKPPDAPVAAYRLLQQRIGTERAVIVTPSTYGPDNACTLAALAQMGGSARGVAVVNADVSGAELQRLAAHRVCGLRVNFVSPQSWGETTPAMLETLARKVAPLGWHIQVFAHPEQLEAMEPLLTSLPVPVVIDHIGRCDPAQGASGPGVDVLRRLLDRGNTWVKLSGIYMRSRDGAPGYRDTFPLGEALARHAPERLVWGSDWPHTTQPPGSVDDADLVDVLLAWCGDPQTLQRVLVDNPARLYGFA
ncbi:amidohydrolase family protein [Ramlibacter ginsenosidimutans]|uniref:Amidohydrolase family protein n=1 Tax=Ramlibacter ginsenosidimutans TaxID=502333 RepID=A0A934TT39_9BURK|nr:amidohydrolase family protein [Ramlibacter ginsenosidimutans]MBK6006883.1 amidohydrolase family protein [Ramlibacter ginsenosidimutans]